jgi:hypothetical protein
LAGDFISTQKDGGIGRPCCVFAIGSNEALPSVRAGLFGTGALSLETQQIQLVDMLRAVAEKDRTISELNMQLLAVQQTFGWRALRVSEKYATVCYPSVA